MTKQELDEARVQGATKTNCLENTIIWLILQSDRDSYTMDLIYELIDILEEQNDELLKAMHEATLVIGQQTFEENKKLSHCFRTSRYQEFIQLIQEKKSQIENEDLQKKYEFISKDIVEKLEKLIEKADSMR